MIVVDNWMAETLRREKVSVHKDQCTKRSWVWASHEGALFIGREEVSPEELRLKTDGRSVGQAVGGTNSRGSHRWQVNQGQDWKLLVGTGSWEES